MRHLLKYLWMVKGLVALTLCCLVLQAYCELALPQYTAALVDVGIQRGGIEDSVPEQLRPASYDALKGEGAAGNMLESSYVRGADGYYHLRKLISRERQELDGVMQEAILRLSGNVETEGNGKPADAAASAADVGDLAGGEVTESVKQQICTDFIREEYRAMGLDLNRIQMDYLLNAGLRMAAAAIGLMLTVIISGLFSARASAKIGYTLRDGIFGKVLTFSNNEMDHFTISSLITRCTNDIQQVNMTCVLLMRLVFYAPVIGIGGIFKVVGMGAGLGWIIVLGISAIVVVCGTLMKIAGPKFQIMQKLVDNVNRVSREMLSGIMVIRAFSREHDQEKRFESASRDLMKTQIFTGRVMALMMPLMMLIMNSMAVLIVWFGGHRIDARAMQVGDMIAYISYSMQVVSAFLMIASVGVFLPRAGVAAGRIQEVLETEPSIQDPVHPRDGEATGKGLVEFRDVSFRFQGAEEDSLSHISFVARPGETTAIIGSTGCGKSTLVNLLCRFYDVTGGSILVDGVDIRELSLHKLHSLLGLVPQKGILFSGTVESNLRFGGDHITQEQMERAAAIAQAQEFIQEKTWKYQEPVAQGGTNVSGGQKQRLSIARAVAKAPGIFLFDDSFSALDYKTDAVLRRELKSKMKDATVIIVAQRISTIVNADTIIVLEEGAIAGMGTHAQLLQECAAYREIAGSQLSQEELLGKTCFAGGEAL